MNNFKIISTSFKHNDEDSMGTDPNNPEDYPCPDCIRVFASKRGLTMHRREIHNTEMETKRAKKPFKCNECDRGFPTEEHLNKHKATHVGFFCDICGYRFTQYGNMKNHRLRHMGVKSFKCDYEQCEYSSFTRRELQSHIMTHTGVMPRVCDVCGKKCRDSGKLKEHMRRHTGERFVFLILPNDFLFNFLYLLIGQQNAMYVAKHFLPISI